MTANNNYVWPQEEWIKGQGNLNPSRMEGGWRGQHPRIVKIHEWSIFDVTRLWRESGKGRRKEQNLTTKFLMPFLNPSNQIAKKKSVDVWFIRIVCFFWSDTFLWSTIIKEKQTQHLALFHPLFLWKTYWYHIPSRSFEYFETPDERLRGVNSRFQEETKEEMKRQRLFEATLNHVEGRHFFQGKGAVKANKI